MQQAILKADAERVVDVSEDTEEKPTGRRLLWRWRRRWLRST